MKKWLIPLFAVLALLVLVLSCAPPPTVPTTPTTPTAPPVGEEVRVGQLLDLSGATSDVGADMALGYSEATIYWNDQGGINGRTFKLILYDYGYRVPEAVTTYKRFRDYDKVVLVHGHGTGDTEALTPTINKDKIVYFSHSFSGHLCDPAKTPYNYVYGTDYSTNARAALQYWYDNYWLKDPRYADVRAVRKPRFCFFGSFATPYSTAPREAIKDQAKLLGMDITTCPDQDVTLMALDTKSQVLAVSANPPDVVWHGNTTMSTATTIKDFYAMGLTGPGKKTMHLVNVWGFDENLVALAGTAVEETIASAVCAYYDWDYPMKATVREYAAKINPGVALEKRLVRTVMTWLQLSMTVKVLKTMDNDGVLDVSSAGLAHTRELCRTYFETCSPFESCLDYGAEPRVYTPTDHRPGSKVLISQVSGGKIVDRGTIDMKALYPDLWQSWLGW